jgi:thioredoxin 1
MATMTLTPQNLAQAMQSPLLVIKFWATWCGPCRMFSPIFDQVAINYAAVRGVVFATCDIDAQSAVAAHFQVRSVPTIAIVKNGQLVHHQSGVVTAQALMGLVNQAAQG